MTFEKNIRLIWISVVLLCGLILSFFIVKPFLAEIFLAGVLAIVAFPLHKKIRSTIPQRGLSAFVSTLLILLLVVVPISFVGTLVVRETVLVASAFDTEGRAIGDAIFRLDMFLARTIPIYDAGTLSVAGAEAYVRSGLGWFANNIQGIFTNILDWIISIAILLLALYYLFKDGDKLYAGILHTSPLEDALDTKIGQEIASIMRAVISGRLVVGLIQGVAAYIGFLFFGTGNALLLATIVAIMSVLPLVGPLLIIIPVALYQMAVGMTGSAIGLIIWGVLVVELVDNLVGPYLIHGKTNLHPFIVLVSILGGLHLFGPVGFIAGPVVIGIVYALFRTLPIIYQAARAQ